jgi:hypothetical protein
MNAHREKAGGYRPFNFRRGTVSHVELDLKKEGVVIITRLEEASLCDTLTSFDKPVVCRGCALQGYSR